MNSTWSLQETHMSQEAVGEEMPFYQRMPRSSFLKIVKQKLKHHPFWSVITIITLLKRKYAWADACADFPLGVSPPVSRLLIPQCRGSDFGSPCGKQGLERTAGGGGQDAILSTFRRLHSGRLGHHCRSLLTLTFRHTGCNILRLTGKSNCFVSVYSYKVLFQIYIQYLCVLFKDI